MATLTLSNVKYHHGLARVANIWTTLNVWRERARQRRELAQWNERDLHDIGVSSSSIAEEVNKPFWRA